MARRARVVLATIAAFTSLSLGRAALVGFLARKAQAGPEVQDRHHVFAVVDQPVHPLGRLGQREGGLVPAPLGGAGAR